MNFQPTGSQLYPNLSAFSLFDCSDCVDKNIREGNFQGAIQELLFFFQDPKTLPDLENAFEYLAILFPRMDQMSFKTLVERLPKFLDLTAHLAKQQNELAIQLGDKFCEHNLDLDALNCFLQAIKIAEMRKDHELKKQAHLKLSNLFLRIIQQQLLPVDSFKKELELARRMGDDSRFRTLLENITILKKLFNRPEDQSLIDERWSAARDVLNEKTGPLGPFLSCVDLIVKERELGQPKNQLPVTERYHQHLNKIRDSFSNAQDLKSLRFFQREVSQKFKDLIQGLILASISILGPPPCEYDIRAIGSMAREEVSPFSDLEFFILIEDEKHREYFNQLLKIFELQVLLFGETASGTIVFTCLGEKNKKGFYLDPSANPLKIADLFGTPEKIADLLKRPITDFDDAIGDPGSQILRSQSLLQQSNNVSKRFDQRLKLLLEAGEDQKLCHIRALKLFRQRLNGKDKTDGFLSVWKKETLHSPVDIKKQFTQFLSFLLSDLAIYWGIQETNTLDVIDALAAHDVFTGNTAHLLKEAVSFLYDLRLRMHQFYGEQKDDAYIKSLSGFKISPSEVEQLEKIYWLILNPLYLSCLSRVVLNNQPVEKVFHQIDLVSVAFEMVYHSQRPAETYLPLVRHAARHFAATKKPIASHLEIFRKLSHRSEHDVLRVCYAEEVEPSLNKEDLSKLFDIPNRCGLRLGFIKGQKSLQELIKLVSSKDKVSSVKITSSLGERYLDQKFIDELLDANGQIKKLYPGSAHNVAQALGLHFKQKPTQPLMEYAIHNLFYRLSGGLTPATELVRFEVKGKAYPVLISRTVQGETLKENLPHELHQDQWTRWTWLLLASVLTRPGDGRLSNFILNKGDVSCIDNDISFVEPIVGKTFSSQIHFCSALFCLFQNRPLDPKVLEEFCELDSNLILESWIDDVIQKENEFSRLFLLDRLSDWYNEDPKNRFKITILFRQGALATLNMQFVYLQNQLKLLLKKSESLTPIKLLEKMIVLKESPLIDETPGRIVAKSYSSASQATVDEKLKWITSRNEDKSLTSLQSDQACLGRIPSFEEVDRRKLFSPTKAKEELYLCFLHKNDDFFKTGAKDGKGFLQANFHGMKDGDEPDLERQTHSLNSLIARKNLEQRKPTSVTLHNCAVLNSSSLNSFLHADLEFLDLSYCPQIKNHDVKTINENCPKLKVLYLNGCSGLTAVQGGNLVVSRPLVFGNLKTLHVARCSNLKTIKVRSLCLIEIKANNNPLLSYAEIYTYLYRSFKLQTHECPLTISKIPFVVSFWERSTKNLFDEDLKDLSEELKDDEAFVLAAIHEDGPAILKYASARLRDSKAILLLAIKNNRYKETGKMSMSVVPSAEALEYASERLKDDKEVVLKAIEGSAGMALKFANPRLKDDREIVIAALFAANARFPYSSSEIGTYGPLVFDQVSERLKNDKEIYEIFVNKKIKPPVQKEKDNQKDVPNFAKQQHIGSEPENDDDDPNPLFVSIKNDPAKLKLLDPQYQKKREFILSAVKENGLALQHADEELKKDEEVVLFAINQSPEAFQYAHQSLKSNIKFVRQALEEVPYLLEVLETSDSDERKYNEWVSDCEVWKRDDSLKVRNDLLQGKNKAQCVAFFYEEESMRWPFKNTSPILKFATPEMRNNKKVVFKALEGNPFSLEYAGEELKSDKEFMLQCIHQCVECFRFSSDHLKRDKGFVLEAIKEASFGFLLYRIKDHGKEKKFLLKCSILAFIQEMFGDDEEVVQEAFNQFQSEFKYASEKIKNNPEFVLPEIEQSGLFLEFCGEKIKQDRKIVLLAVKQNGNALEFANQNLKSDLEIVQEAVQERGTALQFSNPELRKNRALVLLAVKNDGRALEFAHPDLKNDKEIVFAAINQTGLAIAHAGEAFKNDKAVALMAIKENFNSFQLIGIILRSDPEVVLAAVKSFGTNLEFASDSMKDNVDIVAEAVMQKTKAWYFASERLKNNRHLVNSAIERKKLI